MAKGQMRSNKEKKKPKADKNLKKGGVAPVNPFASGKPAVTHYEVVEMLPAASLVEVHLETGRTHQIRVHFAALRHALVGDLTYGADPVLAERLGLTRQWLHAVRLGFEHPATGRWVEFASPYPGDLQVALDRLREAYR